MTKLYSPGGGLLVSSLWPGTCFLLLLGWALIGCSPKADSSPTASATEGEEKPAVAPVKPPSPPETQPVKELPADLEQLRKDIQPEEPAVTAAVKEPEPDQKPAEAAPAEPGESAKAAPPPPETAKAPEPVKPPTPPEGVDEKKLLETLENRMILLGRAFESGNPDEIKKFLIVDDELKVILTGGGYNILGVSLESQNEDAVAQTLKAIEDKKIEFEFVPGKMTYTPNNSIFKKKVPTMSQSKMLFKIDGTPVPFIFYIKQLVWFRETWKIFNAGI